MRRTLTKEETEINSGAKTTNAKAQQTRVVRNVGATQVEQPSNLVKRGHHQQIAAFLGELGAHIGDLPRKGGREKLEKRTQPNEEQFVQSHLRCC